MRAKRLKSGTQLLWLIISTWMVVGFSQAETQFVSPVRQATMIELYTSEGCSSCPPADRWLSRFKQHPDLWQQVIPIAFHVDYWDYIGWKDRFASPVFGERQYLHRIQGNIQQVYTPGLIVNGKEWRGWFKGQREADVLARKAGVLSLALNDKTFSARFSPHNGDKSNTNTMPTLLTIALLGFDLKTTVKAGENEGEMLSHDFVVLAMSTYQGESSQWQGKIPSLDGNINNSQKKALVAWVSYPDNIKPIQALGGWY